MVKKPHALIDYLLKRFSIKSDAKLAEIMELRPPVLSKIRHGEMSVTPGFILNIHETFDIPIKEIKQIANVK